MIIKHLSIGSLPIEEIASLMQSIESYEVGSVNWPDTFPYKPEVEVKIAHTGQELLLQYHVKEQYTMAKVNKDNGEVWTDSCCECFFSFDNTGYYNLETTCIGKALFAFRQSRENAQHAGQEIMIQIRRHSTLGTQTFDEKSGNNEWTLTIALPVSALTGHQIKSLNGLNARMNVYKCGDNLSKPHFLSLFPINTDKPNFHVPEFFQTVHFE